MKLKINLCVDFQWKIIAVTKKKHKIHEKSSLLFFSLISTQKWMLAVRTFIRSWREERAFVTWWMIISFIVQTSVVKEHNKAFIIGNAFTTVRSVVVDASRLLEINFLLLTVTVRFLEFYSHFSEVFNMKNFQFHIIMMQKMKELKMHDRKDVFTTKHYLKSLRTMKWKWQWNVATKKSWKISQIEK